MKNVFYSLVLLWIFSSCKHTTDEIPAPVAPVSFTITADSVKLNPYGYSPLSALVNFSLPMAGKTFVRVWGKHGKLTTIEHTFDDKGTRHSIPVIGLYANYTNTVDIRLIGPTGDTLAKSTLTIQTGDLPPNLFTSIAVAPVDESKVAPGLVLISNVSNLNTSNIQNSTPSAPYFMDAYGDVRWVLDYRKKEEFKTLFYDDGIARLRNGNFFFGNLNSPEAKIYEIDLLGQIVNRWTIAGYSFHHNVIEKPDGNFLLTVTKSGSVNVKGIPTDQDYVIEIDRQTGKVLTEWDLKQSLDEQRTAQAQSPIYNSSDWFHGNSVVYDSTDNTIVVSGRHQGVVKLDYQNKVKWILAAHRGWGKNRRGEDLSQFLLNPVDASGQLITDASVIDGSKITPDFEWNWYQHSNIFLPNGDIMVFDNGDIREYDTEAGRYSRVVSYRIDPSKMTVQQTWTYGKERGTETYAQLISSVQLLIPANHVLFAPGYQVPNATGLGGKLVEIDVATKTVVSEISISTANGWAFHRAKKMSAYP